MGGGISRPSNRPIVINKVFKRSESSSGWGLVMVILIIVVAVIGGIVYAILEFTGDSGGGDTPTPSSSPSPSPSPSPGPGPGPGPTPGPSPSDDGNLIEILARETGLTEAGVVVLFAVVIITVVLSVGGVIALLFRPEGAQSADFLERLRGADLEDPASVQNVIDSASNLKKPSSPGSRFASKFSRATGGGFSALRARTSRKTRSEPGEGGLAPEENPFSGGLQEMQGEGGES